jgi:hypothetical protein
MRPPLREGLLEWFGVSTDVWERYRKLMEECWLRDPNVRASH